MPVDYIESPNNFYLGARVDPETHNIQENAPVYYESDDLTTHGVILGMTGSGKTGLGITLLEEAAIDGIPQIIIDPKGDITNMLLAFPELKEESFETWINPDEAPSDQKAAEYAATVAEEWRAGLEKWDIQSDRIKEYVNSTAFSIYSPGSNAGLPVSILASFKVPPEGWDGNEEVLRKRFTGIVSAILNLIGIDAEPVEDPEHVLLSNIFEYNWRNGTDLSLEKLILQVQEPPFIKLGAMDVEEIIPKKDRVELAKKLNNIIAAPSFQSWLVGEPLRIPSLLYTDSGQPRTTIFYIAHLNEEEQQFFVTLLLESILSWMNSLSGTNNLRAMLYIDEIFGMFPPHPHYPPTKEPLLRLLKQARAFGVGLLMATQNAKDIDYKGLSNAGTWVIGKLQTENDRQRVLEGLESVNNAESPLDLDKVGKLIGGLKPREFIMHNIHATDSPILMKTRRTLSYLRGPLTLPQVEMLMKSQHEGFTPTVYAKQPRNMMGSQPSDEMVGRLGAVIQPDSEQNGDGKVRKKEEQEMPSDQPTYSGETWSRPGSEEQAPVTQDQAPPGYSAAQPSLTSSTQQYFLPVDFAVEQAIKNWEDHQSRVADVTSERRQLLYKPSLLAQSTVRYKHSPTDSYELLWYAFVVPNLPRMAYIEWGNYQAEPFDPKTLETKPFGDAYYGFIPSELRSGGFTELKNSLEEWVYTNLKLTVYHNPVLDMYNGLNESRSDFVTRVQDAARQRREEELAEAAAAYERKFDDLERRVQRKRSRLDAEETELDQRKREETVTAIESMWRLLKGQLYQTIQEMSETRTEVVRSREREEVLREDLVKLLQQVDETEAEMESELQGVRNKWANAARQIEEIPVTPNKKDITVVLFGVGWVPYWGVEIDNQLQLLPATPSGIAVEQQPLSRSQSE